MESGIRNIADIEKKDIPLVEYYKHRPVYMKALIILIAMPVALVLTTAVIDLGIRVFGEFNIFAMLAIILYCGVQFHKEGENTSNKDIIILFLVALFIRTAFCFLYNLEPISDFLNTYNRALSLSQAPVDQWYSLLGWRYTQAYSNITPYIIYEALVIKLFGDSYLPLQIINIIASAGVCVFVSQIAKTIFANSKNIRAITLCAGYTMAVNPVALFFISVLTNQHIALFLFIGAIYFFICKPLKNIWANVAICGIMLSFSQIIRPEMGIVIIAFICYLIYLLINFMAKKPRDSKPIVSTALGIMVVIILFFGINFSTDYILRSIKVIDTSITETNFLYKVAVGLNHDTSGKFNKEDEAIITDSDALLVKIKERTASKSKLIDLFLKKIDQNYAFYGSVFYYFRDLPDDNIYMQIRYYVYQFINNGFMLLMLASVVFSIFAWIREATDLHTLIFIILSGFTLVFLIVEIQPRYLQILFPLFAIFAAKTNAIAVYKIKEKIKLIIK